MLRYHTAMCSRISPCYRLHYGSIDEATLNPEYPPHPASMQVGKGHGRVRSVAQSHQHPESPPTASFPDPPRPPTPGPPPRPPPNPPQPPEPSPPPSPQRFRESAINQPSTDACLEIFLAQRELLCAALALSWYWVMQCRLVTMGGDSCRYSPPGHGSALQLGTFSVPCQA